MQFEEYNYEDYQIECSRIDRHDPIYIKSSNMTIQFVDISAYLLRENRTLPQIVLQLIISHFAPKNWRMRVAYNNTISQVDNYTHTLVLGLYEGEWHLAIQDKTKMIYSYGISVEGRKYLSELCYHDLKLGHMIVECIDNQQDTVLQEGDTSAMVKILYMILKLEKPKLNIENSSITKWQEWIYVIDMFLFAMRRRIASRMQSQSQQDTIQLSQSRNSKSYEKSLGRSARMHQQPPQMSQNDEMIELSKEDFIYMMDKFKKEVVSEIKQVKSIEPDVFLSKKLSQMGKLTSRNVNGQIQYQVDLKPEQLDEMLKEYELYYNQEIYNEKYEEAKQKQSEQYQYYLQFQQLLNYYYQTDPFKYQQLINDYNQRLNKQLVERVRVANSEPKELPQNTQRMNAKRISQSYLVNSQNNMPISRQSNKILSPSLVHSRLMKSKSPNNISIVAYRYDKSIGQSEFQRFQVDSICSENILNFLIRYIEEKQATQLPDSLKAQKLRILYMTTTFFKTLTRFGINPDTINYKDASFYTKQYTGRNNTVFDLFDSILIPIMVNETETTLLKLHLTDKQIVYYDTIVNGDGSQCIGSSLSPQDALINNPNILCCLRFLDREHNEKLMKQSSLFQWPIFYSQNQKTANPEQSNLLLIMLIHSISNGGGNIQANQAALMEFKGRICQLLVTIGVTKNKKNELRFDKMVL